MTEVLDFVSQLSEEPQNKKTTSEPNSHIFIQFCDPKGDLRGEPISLLTTTNTLELEKIIKTEIEKNESHYISYEFFISDIQVLDALDVAVRQYRAKIFGQDKKKAIESVENVIKLTYQPQAAFHVKPVKSCSSSIPGHKGAVLVAQFSPNGKALATGSGDSTVRFYDLLTELPSKIGDECHNTPVLCLSWSPDCLYLASGCQGGKVGIWTICKISDCLTQDEENSSLDKPVKRLGEMFLKSTLVRKNSNPGKKWIRSIVWRPYHLEPLCRHIAVGYQDNTLVIWDTFQNKEFSILSGHDRPITCIRWGGSDLIYTASQDRTVRVWKWETGLQVHSLSMHSHWVNTLALSTDYVLRTGPFDPAKAQLIQKNPHVVNQLTTPESREELRLEAKKLYDKYCGDGERMVVGSDDYTLSLWKPIQSSKAICERMTGHQGVVNDAKFSPDGRLIASASFDHSVKIWDGKNGNFLATMYGHVMEVYLVAWSSDSRLLVSGSKDSTIKLWTMTDVRRWNQDDLLATHQTKTIKENAKFKRLPIDPIITADNAIASKKRKINAVPFQRKRHLLHDLPGHADAVYALDWSPDGQRVVSGSKDRVVKL